MIILISYLISDYQYLSPYHDIGKDDIIYYIYDR